MDVIQSCIDSIPDRSKLRRMDSFIQHGSTSCLKHTVAVAYMSMRIAERLHIGYRKSELIRGALLHDYFLYDWHDGNGRGIHGFTHPSQALKNAERDFKLTKVERDIIKKHMFPLTVVPPMYRESWIVCLADKICSLLETFNRKNTYSNICGSKAAAELSRQITNI